MAIATFCRSFSNLNQLSLLLIALAIRVAFPASSSSDNFKTGRFLIGKASLV
jgi:hypothetical protein